MWLIALSLMVESRQQTQTIEVRTIVEMTLDQLAHFNIFDFMPLDLLDSSGSHRSVSKHTHSIDKPHNIVMHTVKIDVVNRSTSCFKTPIDIFDVSYATEIDYPEYDMRHVSSD
jgi:L-arabinose isomerase